jgi:hypothetical protein
MNKSLQGRFRDDINNQYSYSYVQVAKRNRRCVADSKIA